jgi:hypothetical protein
VGIDQHVDPAGGPVVRARRVRLVLGTTTFRVAAAIGVPLALAARGLRDFRIFE